MVAYSFKPRFVEPIRVGLGERRMHTVHPKRQTIRADRRRHARPGEELQLYRGLRTKGCYLIGRARCIDVVPIQIHFRKRRRSDWVRAVIKLDRPSQLDHFARDDGFRDWQELREFWAQEHPGVDDFEGVLITWGPLL